MFKYQYLIQLIAGTAEIIQQVLSPIRFLRQPQRPCRLRRQQLCAPDLLCLHELYTQPWACDKHLTSVWAQICRLARIHECEIRLATLDTRENSCVEGECA